MMVPLLGPRLGKVYQSFEITYLQILDKVLDLFIEFKFCESDREQKLFGGYL